MPTLPSRDELRVELQAVLQETNPQRELDSIETVTMQAYLASRGLEYPDGTPTPTTIEEWVVWAGHFSAAS